MTQRVEKVQKLARQVLGELIQELKDPRVGFVTVTAVRMTPDLRSARVFVSVLGTEAEQEDSIAGLKSATPHLRSELGHEMRLKYTPELTFQLDHGPEEAQRLETLLKKIHHDEDGE
ncbi:MAG TPA: 30S ribosome-binding factor RbfA [Actinomycetota bacterium]|nr:30S ribosome-binding factor RbfA [Actinomycetota bacterium]